MHGRDQDEPLLDTTRGDLRGHLLGDVDDLLPILGVKPQVLRVGLHDATRPARSASVSSP